MNATTPSPAPGNTTRPVPPVTWPAIERGGGLPLVFLHGYPLNHTMWMPLLESLPDGTQAVLLDLPGYGLAEDWSVPDTLAGFSESVHRALAGRFRGPAVLVGHSFGGYLALQLYHDHPDQFRGLVLTNTRSGADSPEGPGRSASRPCDAWRIPTRPSTSKRRREAWSRPAPGTREGRSSRPLVRWCGAPDPRRFEAP